MKILMNISLITFFFLLITGCNNNPKVNIPKTEKNNVEDDYFGTKVSDPYRWLENTNSPEVKKWIEEQNNYADKVLSEFTQVDVINKRINELSTTSAVQFSPQIKNGKLFFEQFTPPQAQPVVAYKDWPNGETNILIDPNKSEKNIAVTGFWPSPKGNFLAYGLAEGGNEATTIHIINVSDGKTLTDSLPFAGGGATPAGMVWDANEKGLTYVRLPLPESVPESESQFYAALYHHKLGDSFKDDKLVFGKDLSKVAEYAFIPSENGEHAAMFVHFGDGNPDYVYLRKEIDKWEKILGPDDNVRVASEVNPGAAWDGDNLLVVVYKDAPLGKLFSISENGKSKTLVDQGDWAMNSISPVKGGFLISKVKGAAWKVDQYNNDGKIVRTLDLPKNNISISTIASSSNAVQALITYSGWTTPATWSQFNSNNGELKTIFQVKPSGDYSNVKVQVIEAISKDGTKIPVSILYTDGTTPNGKRPTIVYAYGGFGIPTAPRFLGSNLLWLENGGVMAYANIRGGGEFGEGWHADGMLDKKQNDFDDMYAAAEAMVKNNWTDSEHLGILGGSNGGLLMGAELTQHPEAFKAVVSFVGIYDMLRNELFPNGQYNISEYGTSTKSEDFKWLYAYSPYHNVKENTKYPATLLFTGINDPRVASWQSRKFVAALQAANISDNPILLITRMNEGHGVTASFSQRVGNTAAELTFFAHELGLEIK